MMLINGTQRTGVYGVLFDNQTKKILLTQTQSGSKIIYNFPGGGVDKHESFNQALIRECKEELGVDVSIKKQIYTTEKFHVHEDFPSTNMSNIYFLITTQSCINGHSRNDINTLGIAWFALKDFPVNQMLSVDKEFVEYLQDNPKKLTIC
jgi:8-oxo-dGTP pyrophosphatase MutT (NUDIX family)